MALTGIHIEFGFGGTAGARVGPSSNAILPLLQVVDSETVTAAGTSTKSVPDGYNASGQPIARVTAAVASFVAFGATPNATTGARVYIGAGETRDYVVKSGDRVAWIAA